VPVPEATRIFDERHLVPSEVADLRDGDRRNDDRRDQILEREPFVGASFYPAQPAGTGRDS
jgi:hypothetical protein